MLAAGTAKPDEVVYLWPCNVDAWHAWCELQTQWRHGVGGPTGLDYASVLAYLDELGHIGDERRALFSGLRAAERATLEAWAEKRQREEQNNANR